jgi:hypothetical protein
MRNIFLSAGVPEPDDEAYGATADPLLIHSAIRSLCTIAFGHKRLVWGGHPAITPMMWAACENMGINYATTVHLYQSRFFAEMYPEENKRFQNVTYVRAGRDIEQSLAFMRSAMMRDYRYEAGVFIGGKSGVEIEFDLFRRAHPRAAAIIFPSTGGASMLLAKRYPKYSAPGGDFVDFIGYLSNLIRVEMRGG